MISFLQEMPPLALWALQIPLCYGMLLLFFRLFGIGGIFAFNAGAIILANIQVLKVASVFSSVDPIALGTVAFTTTFLGTDILAEYCGKQYAKQAVGIGFAALLFSTALMTLTIGIAPVEDSPEMGWALALHQNLEAVFSPAPALLLAGMCAYLVSQLFDIYLFDTMRRKFHGKQLWLRNCVSTACSSLIDNIIFSVLAWVVLADNPLAWKTVIFTYILGTYFIRLILVLLDTPFIYWAKHCRPKSLKN